MIQQIITPLKPKMEAAIEHFEEEIRTLRTGRANVQMLDGVLVPYYGVMTPLKSLANLSISDSQTIVITPFDTGTMNDVRLGIEQANLGFRTSDDGRVMRISIPPLTSERREELVKQANKMAEGCRIVLRNVRGEVWDKIQAAQKAGEISEDNRDWGRAEIDKITADYNKKVEDLVKAKEAEIRTV